MMHLTTPRGRGWQAEEELQATPATRVPPTPLAPLEDSLAGHVATPWGVQSISQALFVFRYLAHSFPGLTKFGV